MNFDDLIANHASQKKANAVFTDDAGSEMILFASDLDTLTADDFIF